VLNQPAGHLDPGESLVDACRREVMEETGAPFSSPRAWLVSIAGTTPRRTSRSRFCFFGKAGNVEQRPLDKEIVRLHWLTPGELKKRQAEHRSPLVQKCVDDFLAGRRYPLELFSTEFA
jgi:8-oxo-dGTP pyrophosphatase MutT (NUDIX family)